MTALHTGFRKSALLSLTWDDVDRASQSITVQAAYAKNSESRSVPMNDVLTATLEGVRITSTATGAVFRNRKGMPYRSCRSAFERAVRKAAIRNFTFHDLRHTFASRLVMAGVRPPHRKRIDGTQKHQYDTAVYAFIS